MSGSGDKHAEPVGWIGCEVEGDPLLLGIAFSDKSRGFAVGGTTERGPCVIVGTEDGGLSWAPLALREDALGRLYDIDFPTKRRGYAVGFGVILRTKDRGRAWEPVTIPADRWLAAVDFISEDVGFAVGGHDQAAVIWQTTDGGDNWIEVEDRLPESCRSALRDVHFEDETHGFVLGENGLLCETFDAGSTWNRIDAGSDAWLRSIYVQGKREWIAASPGLLTREGDGPWMQIAAFAEEKLNAVHFLTDQFGWVTRYGGSVHGTFDGGATWFPSLELKGTPSSLTQVGDEWLFVASDSGVYRLMLPR